MPIVDVAGVGTVEFPDGMSSEDIKGALQKKFPPMDLTAGGRLTPTPLGPVKSETGMEAGTEFTEALAERWKKPIAKLLPDLPGPLRRSVESQGTPSDKRLMGTYEGVQETLNNLTSPENVALLVGTAGVGTEAKLLSKLVGVGFAAHMGKNLSVDVAQQLGEEYGKPPAERDQTRIGQLLGQAGVETTLIGAIGKGLAEKPTIETKGAPDATQERPVQEGSQPEHPGTEAQRLPTGPSGSDKPIESGTVPEGQAPRPVLLSPAIEQAAESHVQSGKVLIPGEEPGTIGGGIKRAVEKGGEAGAIQLPSRQQVQQLFKNTAAGVKTAFDEVRKIADEVSSIKRADDFDRGILGWSGKLQQSFGEADRIQKDILKRVPKESEREGITNWIQAGGNTQVLLSRAAATADPKLKRGYIAATRLSPEALRVAQEVQNMYNVLHGVGTRYGVLNSFIQDYVTQVWKQPSALAFGSGRTLRNQFKFAKQRMYDSYFSGEQAGLVPKTKDISKLFPSYKYELESVISARQLAVDLANGVAKDGRPLVAPKGVGTPVGTPGNQATLVMPSATKGPLDMKGYEVIPKQPALRDWQWAAKDSAGNNVFLNSDLAVHPEVYNHLKNVLGGSKIREWYTSESERFPLMVIPKKIVHALDFAQRETKQTMLGFLSPFHQFQEGTHGIGHRVNPSFNVPTIDLRNAAQADAAKHGLMLKPDKQSANNFMEGLRTSALIEKIPFIGPIAESYRHYLFEQYIPGLKFKTYEAMVDRNMKVFANDIRQGSVTPEDVKILSATQANAAYGHLNYTLLGRNPTVQHAFRLIALAPDFFEARMRFAGQAVRGATGAKVGREQLVALGTLAIAQATAAYTMAKLIGGTWDPKRPFEFHDKDRRYTIRSVPEDIAKMVENPRQFFYSRLNPLTGKVPWELATGRDWRGQPIEAKDVMKEAIKQPVPLTLRPLFGMGSAQELKEWEELAGAAGLKISRFSPEYEIYQRARDWKLKSDDPKIRAQAEREKKEIRPLSEYQPLRQAVLRGDAKAVRKEFDKLTAQGKDYDAITKAWSTERPFTGNKDSEDAFYGSLSDEDKKLYESAIDARAKLIEQLGKLLDQTEPK